MVEDRASRHSNHRLALALQGVKVVGHKDLAEEMTRVPVVAVVAAVVASTV